MRALVTAGGTSEPVDDVRVLTNRSTGRFGAAIARALHEAGVETTLLGSRAMLARADVALPAGVRCVAFESFLELEAALETECREGRPDLVWMAAAVSDYSPVRAEGKLSSRDPQRTIQLVRNPKLLARLRAWCGEQALLVGFKLLSHVSEDEPVRVARAQIEGAQLDLCVANDLALLGGSDHPVRLVSASDVQPLEGPRADVARALVDVALARLPTLDLNPESASFQPCPAPLAAALGLGATLWLRGPGLALHPTARVAPPASPARLAAALAAAWTRDPPARGVHGAFSLDMGRDVAHSPSELGLGQAAWALTQERLDARLEALGVRRPVARGPILVGERLVGALARTTQWVTFEPVDAPWIGAALARCARERFLALPGEEDALREHGFLALGGPDPPGALLCEAPLRWPRHSRGASTCLYAPRSDQVLIGRRLKPPYEGYWAFPGGAVEPGESPAQAAARELHEETGLRVPPGDPWEVFELFVGGPQRVFRLQCRAISSLTTPPPSLSDEFAAEWVSVKDALERRGLAAGTRRVLFELFPSRSRSV